MLLILLFNVIFVTTLVAANLTREHSRTKNLLSVISVITGIIFVFLCIYAIGVNLNRDALEAEWSERYDALYSQAYYKMYEGNSAKKKLADQIMEWNIEYETYWANKDNIWISCFYPIRAINYRPISIELLGINQGGVG